MGANAKNYFCKHTKLLKSFQKLEHVCVMVRKKMSTIKEGYYLQDPQAVLQFLTPEGRLTGLVLPLILLFPLR